MRQNLGMRAAVTRDYVSVEEYLAAESESDIHHEFLGGLVYAMAGETRDHNQIAQNLLINLRSLLKGGPCKVYMSDIRVNLHLRNDEYYYYPDIVVTCDARDTHKRFVHYPKLIIEVLSESTERVDRREKFFAYTSMESLEEYALVSQSANEVTLFRRTNDWLLERVSGATAKATLNSPNASIPLSAIYEGI